jgi:hypothetical protein
MQFERCESCSIGSQYSSQSQGDIRPSERKHLEIAVAIAQLTLKNGALP